MRKVILKLGKAFLFIFLVMFLLIEVGNRYRAAAPQVNPVCAAKWDEFYGLKKKSIDVVYLGSSHPYRGFDANYIDQKFKIRSFNMGTPLQKPVESYYVLKEVLSYQKPKTVVFDVFWNIFNSEKYFQTKTVNYDCMRMSLNKIQYLLNVFDKDQYLSAALYAVRYHDLTAKVLNSKLYVPNNKPIVQKNTSSQRPPSYIGKGFVRCDTSITPAQSAKIAGKTTNQPYGKFIWDEEQWSYMQKIYDLCRDNGVKLVLVTIPSCPSRIISINKYEYPYKDVYKKVASFAKAHKLFYKDYNIENQKHNFFKDADFSDNNHLNYEGSHKFADVFFKALKKSKALKFLQ